MDELVVDAPTEPDHVEVWHCEQPEAYRVLSDHWDFERWPYVRHVYEVEPVS